MHSSHFYPNPLGGHQPCPSLRCACPQGPLPANWTLPASLLELALSSNQLTGTVPEDWLPDGLQVAPLLRLLLLKIAELRLTDVNQEDLSISASWEDFSVSASLAYTIQRGEGAARALAACCMPLPSTSHCALPEVG